MHCNVSRIPLGVSTLHRLVAVAALALALLTGAAVAMADATAVREITWDALVPPVRADLQKKALDLDRELRAMPEDKRKLYDKVALEMLIRDEIDEGLTRMSSLTDREKRLLENNEMRKHPEIAEYWRQYNRVRNEFDRYLDQVRPDMNDVTIRMPGYVLPLEFDGDKVTEFLLVPFVGACIHKPVPPANQMVYVKIDKPFRSRGLYAPVWVEGRMFARNGTHNLSLVDGSKDVDSGYSIQATRITPYEREKR